MTLPPGVAQAFEIIQSLDQCFANGFPRLDPTDRECLTELAGVFSQSPMSDSLRRCAQAIERGEFVPDHFVTLAAARSALQGARYDALHAAVCSEYGLECEAAPETLPIAPGETASPLAATRQWLVELAMTGFLQLGEDAIAPFSSTIESLQRDASYAGAAALLSGFLAEMLAMMPLEQQPEIPLTRWMDLWANAMIRTGQSVQPTSRRVSGHFVPLGLDLNRHSQFVRACVYGVFSAEGDTPQVARLVMVSHKVDVLVGAELWDLFGERCDPVFQALGSGQPLGLSAAELSTAGDLSLIDPPTLSDKTLGDIVDPFAALDQARPLPPMPAAYRHPVHLAQVVLVPVDRYPLATERMHNGSEIDEKVLKQTVEFLGLLRFDGGEFRLQPLIARKKKGFVMQGSMIARQRAKLKKKVLGILTERASRLLRA